VWERGTGEIPGELPADGGDTGHRRSGHTEFGDSGDDAGQNAGSGSNREHHPIRVGKARRTYAKYLDVP
jgi:hypothetical protein